MNNDAQWNVRIGDMTNEQKSHGPRVVTANRRRLGGLALAVAGILYVLYPALRPFSDETALTAAAAFASTQWIVAHVLAMLGFILFTLGLVAVTIALQATTVERLAFRGAILSGLGTGLTLPYYGAEAFGLHAIGQEALRQHSAALVNLANDVRFGPGSIFILVGLVLLAAGSIMVAIAVWKSHALPKWSGIPLALGFLLYIPQYVAPQPIRVAHGLVLATGCLWLAVSVWRHGNQNRERN